MEMDNSFIIGEADQLHVELLDVMVIEERTHELRHAVGVGVSAAVKVAELPDRGAGELFLIKAVFTGALHQLVIPEPAGLVCFSDLARDEIIDMMLVFNHFLLLPDV